MRALEYFIAEAASSLWRGRGAAILSVLTIGAGLFVLGFFLIVNTNLQRVAARWGEAAEFAIYLRDDVTPGQVEALQQLVQNSGLAAAVQHVTKAQAAERFAQEFPDLGPTAARLERNPFPASLDVRLRADLRGAEDRVDHLAQSAASQPGVVDVRYDRRWLSRLHSVIRFVRVIGSVIVGLLALAAALTVANVVRLAAHARRDEIEIMQLVGAPFTYIRGPLVLEGVLQGGAGALAAIVMLGVVFAMGRARYGSFVADLLGPGSIRFLPVELAAVLLLGGMLLGCLGGLIVARGVR